MASYGRTPEQIKADLAATRKAMSEGIEGLVSEVHPTAIKNRAINEAKESVENTKQMFVDAAKDVLGFFYDEETGVRWNNVGTVALCAAGVIVAVGTMRGALGLVGRVIAK